MSFPLARSTAVAANISLQSTAVPTQPASTQTAGVGRPWLVGSAVFAIGLAVLACAFVVALRKEKI
jgi:hypothetical protein